MRRIQPVLAIAHTVDPAAVKALLANANEMIHDGAILVTIPEDGMTDLIYCRYGLGIPYYKVQVGEKLWVKPTIGYNERWVYEGLADVGGATLPAEQMVLGNQLRTYITNLVTEINAELVTKLNTQVTTFNTHTHVVPAAPGSTNVPTVPSTVSASPTTDATDVILSDVIYGKKI